VIVPDFTGVARLADEALTEHLGKHKIGVVHPRDSGRTSCRFRRIAESNVPMSELILRVNLKPMSTATTKSHGFTEVKIVASVLLFASHPSHMPSGIIMKEHGAMELSYKDRTIVPSSLFITGLQAHKIIQPHILQGINHKAVLGGLVHGKHFLVDGLGHHNDTILHTLSRVVEIIPYAHLSVGPE
jgi:hypothetical protein